MTAVTEAEVEAAACAIYVAGGGLEHEWSNVWGPARERWREHARAALEAASLARPAPAAKEQANEARILRIIERHLGAWIKEEHPDLKLIPLGARQDASDLAHELFSIFAPTAPAADGEECQKRDAFAAQLARPQEST